MIDERLARKERPELGDLGYSAHFSVYWNLDHDIISYSFHDGLEMKEWTEEEKKTVFSAEFMRREWLYKMIKTQALVETPDQFFMRSHLYPGKFPNNRNVNLPADLKARYDAQESAGQLVFESGPEG